MEDLLVRPQCSANLLHAQRLYSKPSCSPRCHMGALEAFKQQKPLTRLWDGRRWMKCFQNNSPGTKVSACAAVTDEATADTSQSSQAKQLRLVFGTKVLPHPDKASYGGEDAFFVSEAGGGAMGVADGVGGWQESGVNPAEYSRTFMRIACHYFEGKTIHPVTPGEIKEESSSLRATDSDASSSAGTESDGMQAEDPQKVAEMLTARGALAAAHAGTRLPGSSTACVLRLNRLQRTVETANLGDSGFMLVRDRKVVYRSPVLQHFFDCPLQFGAVPDFSESTDSAEDAAIAELQVQPGDVLLAGSDGLWDNCYDPELLQLLPEQPEGAQQAAGAIAELARQHANDQSFKSPYTQEALKQGYDVPWWEKIKTASFADGKFELGTLTGGKIDDITVLVAVVTEEDVPLEEPSSPVAEDAASATEGSNGSSSSEGEQGSTAGPQEEFGASDSATSQMQVGVDT